MRRTILAGLVVLAGVGITAPAAHANLDDQSACQQVDERSQATGEELAYLSNPLRSSPHNQASIIMAGWGVDTNDPFPRNITIYAKGAQSVVCVIDYHKVGGFNVEWHVVTEVRVTGDLQATDHFWNTARNCYGITNGGNGSLIAPPSGCGAYGAVDGNTALD
jgi:hypothetical protein